MNLQTYSLAAIRTPKATYLDGNYEYKQSAITCEQGFSFNLIDALSGAYDSSINNYTSQYLTGLKKLEDFISLPGQKDNYLRTITTPLILNDLTSLSVPKVLNVRATGDNTTTLSILSTVDYNNSGSFFELSFINNKVLRVLHNAGNGYYVLNVINQNNLQFIPSISTYIPAGNEGDDIFQYQLDSTGYLQLYKEYNNTLFAVNLSGTSLTLVNVLCASFGRVNKLFRVYYNYETINPKLNTSWISYNTNKVNTLSINNEKSDFDKTNQYILHTNYNEVSDTIELNHIALDNSRSEKGFIKRGASTTINEGNIPSTLFREYTTLRTGNDQERGDDHISLIYTWYDKDIEVYSGRDTYFVTPSSLYPYEKLNINDTKFIYNGSLPSTSPLLADKIYRSRAKSTTFENGRYLCTWLSGGASNMGMWVDRYYYPDRISKQAALSSSITPAYSASFLDPIDSIYYTPSRTSNFIFDKKSDLTIEPNTRYYYSRIDSNDIQNALINTMPLVSGFSNYYTTNNVAIPYISDSIVYDGTKYNKFNIKDPVNCSSQFTISFDLFVNPGTPIGYSLANSSREFTILNDTKVTPFITLYQDNIVYIYNTNYTLIKTITFDTDVRDIIVYKPLDDFFVICNNGLLYKVNELGNKLKKEVIPITSYKNYTQDDNYIYFLLDITGVVVRVNKFTFNYTTVYATLLPLYVNEPIQGKHRSLIIYNNILYSIPGERFKYKNADEIYFLLHNKQLWYYNLITNTARSLFDTSSTINDFALTTDNNIIILTDTNWYQYTSNRVYVLSGTTVDPVGAGPYKNIHVDIIREYTDTGLNESATILMLSGSNLDIHPVGNLVVQNILTSNITNVETAPNKVDLGITGQYVSDTSAIRKRYNLTNFNKIQALGTDLSFNMTLTNYLSSEDTLQQNIELSLQDLDIGYHTFTYRFDSRQGNITLFIDGIIYKNLTIPPNKYNIQQILSEDLYLGAVGIVNGLDLATYLKQPGYYYLNNTSIRNCHIYDRALKTDEIFALNINKDPIDNLVLSIPSGQRSNIEEIERYFKYSPVSSSKSINIYVKNAGITNTDFKNNIKNIILDQTASALPVGIKINDIQFIDFK